MAEELGKLTQHVGGAEHAHVLLLPLETLCAPEEAMVIFFSFEGRLEGCERGVTARASSRSRGALASPNCRWRRLWEN